MYLSKHAGCEKHVLLLQGTPSDRHVSTEAPSRHMHKHIDTHLSLLLLGTVAAHNLAGRRQEQRPGADAVGAEGVAEVIARAAPLTVGHLTVGAVAGGEHAG
jgi:hypothetical protein